jgi:hypothetical protein
MQHTPKNCAEEGFSLEPAGAAIKGLLQLKDHFAGRCGCCFIS